MGVAKKWLLASNTLATMRLREGVKMIQPHAHQLRKGRHSQAGGVYLISTVTAHREPLFSDFFAARTLVQVLHHPHLTSRTQTLAYVVMPDHLHWLLQLGDTETLSQCVQRLKFMSAKALNPDLWQKGFHDRAVLKEEDLHAIAR